MAAVAAALSTKRELLVTPGIKSKRRKFDKQAKQAAVDQARELGVTEAARRLNNVSDALDDLMNEDDDYDDSADNDSADDDE